MFGADYLPAAESSFAPGQYHGSAQLGTDPLPVWESTTAVGPHGDFDLGNARSAPVNRRSPTEGLQHRERYFAATPWLSSVFPIANTHDRDNSSAYTVIRVAMLSRMWPPSWTPS